MSPRLMIVALTVFAVAALAGPVLLLTSADEGSAAFGDSETIGVNRLSSATVEIAPGEDIVPITATNLAPGDRVTGAISIRNVGSLTVRYAILSEATTNALADWLWWEIWLRPDNDQCDEPPSPQELLVDGVLFGQGSVAVLGDPTVGLDPGDRILLPGDDEALCTAVTLALDAPDDVQASTVRHELIVVAEQHTDELEGASS